MAILHGSWPFPAPLLKLDDVDFTIAAVALSEAQRMRVEYDKSLADYGAARTIEFLARAMK